MVKYKIGDREYEFDGVFTLEESMWIFDRADVGVSEVVPALNRGNPYVITTFMFILKKRAHEAVRWEDMKYFTVNDFVMLADDTAPAEEDAEPVAGESPDPTEGGGTTPQPDTTTT